MIKKVQLEKKDQTTMISSFLISMTKNRFAVKNRTVHPI